MTWQVSFIDSDASVTFKLLEARRNRQQDDTQKDDLKCYLKKLLVTF